MNAEARVATGNASHYIKVLCNHFGRKVAAEFTATQGSVQFPFGVCQLSGDPEELVLRVQADNDQQLAQLKGVVGEHLEKFARRGEVITVVWQDALAITPAEQ